MNHQIKIVLFGYLLFGFSYSIWAQDIPLEQYSSLRKQAINDIAIDSQNQIWIATANGLLKLEKDSFQRFDPASQSDTYTQRNVSCIRFARNKTIWLGTYQSVILKIDSTGKFNYFDFSNLGTTLITSITEDTDGKIWAGTSGKGVFTVDLLNGKSHYSTENSKIASNRIFAIHADKFGNKWVGTSHGLCRIQNNEKWETYKIDGQITAIKEFQNSLWVIAVNDEGSELWKYENFEKWTKLDVPATIRKTRIMDFDADSYGKMAFVSDKVVISDNGQVKTYASNNGFMSESGLCIAIDYQGVIWIGTEGKGLFHTSKNSLRVLPKELDDVFTTDSIEKFIEMPVRLPIEFNQGSAELLITSEPELERVAQLLRKFPDLKLRLAGHTDNIGNPQKNLQLSERRAVAIKGYLVQQKDISAERISCVGYGGQRPIADNAQEITRQKNRRVEMILFK